MNNACFPPVDLLVKQVNVIKESRARLFSAVSALLNVSSEAFSSPFRWNNCYGVKAGLTVVNTDIWLKRFEMLPVNT